MENNFVKCRACWEEKRADSVVQVTESWGQGSNQTIKDIILFCVSTLSIQDDSYLCKTCIWQLKFTYHFIDRCLKTEQILQQTTTEDIQNSTVSNENPDNIHEILEKSVEEGKTIRIIFEDEKLESPVYNAVKQELQEFLDIPDTDNCTDYDNDTCNNEVNTLPTEQKNPVLNDHSYAEEFTHLTSKYPQELVDTLDFVPVDMRCLVVKEDMPLEQQTDIKKAGINILNLSVDPRKKKRVVYLGRDVQYTGISDGTCQICKIRLYSRADLVDHKYRHKKGEITLPPDVNAFDCKDCSGRFSDINLYRNHCRIFHKNMRPLQCPKCLRRFGSPEVLKSHVEYFKQKEKCVYSCQKCQKEFGTKRSLQNHLDDVADAPSCDYKVCKICNEKFTRTDFAEHCLSVHPNYVCSICDKSYPSAAKLNAHRSAIHTDQKVMCQICGQQLASNSSLRCHIQALHVASEKYMCDKCPRQFKTRLYLRKHTKMKHGGSEPIKTHVCETCGKAFIDRGRLRQHQQLMHESCPPKFICDICKEGFVRKDYYTRHLRRHITNEKLNCGICKKVFRGERLLETHLEYGHDENGKSLEPPDMDLSRQRMRKKLFPFKHKFDASKYIKPCICRICGHMVQSFMYLKNHYKAHLKIREYSCDKCKVSLQSEVSYKRHIKLHENPNFEFSCNICHAYTSSYAALEKHMLKHTRKKYECNYCDEKFGRKFLLYDHEATMHKMENEKRQELYNLLINEPPMYARKDVYNAQKKKKGKTMAKFNETLEEIIQCLAMPAPDYYAKAEQDIEDASTVSAENPNFGAEDDKFGILDDDYKSTKEEQNLEETSAVDAEDPNLYADGDRFDILDEDYQMTEEEAQACQVLMNME